MSTEVYELVALGARYWFLLLGAVIVWRSFKWLRQDRRAHNRVLRSLPDAGMVGEIVDLNTNKTYPLPREGVLGAARQCDIRVTGEGLRARELDFSFVPEKGVRLRPRGRREIELDGAPVYKEDYALHGSRMRIGDCEMRVRLFAGLPAPSLKPEFMPETEAEGIFFPLPDDIPSDDAPPSFPEGVPQTTWPYAMYPVDLVRQAQTEEEPLAQDAPPPFEVTQKELRRRRRSGR